MRAWAALGAMVSCCALFIIGGCTGTPRVTERVDRRGDEIAVCGQLFHTGAPVVLWTDPGGYDAYRVERRFVPWAEAGWEATSKAGIDSPARYNTRFLGLTDEELERVRGGGWDLPLLQSKVDQFVLHYDVCGTSRTCFRVLHDQRGLSIHFMLDIDGTIYQTLDVKERAWHATSSNHRSVGIEIANMGSYKVGGKNPFDKWYARDPDGRTRITIPSSYGDGGVRTPNFVGRPLRNEPVVGPVQGEMQAMYDLTPQQYDSLIKLTATLCKVLPKITPDYPKDEQGRLITHQLPPEMLKNYSGVLGHYHVQDDKADPGSALNWELLMSNVRRVMKNPPRIGEPIIPEPCGTLQQGDGGWVGSWERSPPVPKVAPDAVAPATPAAPASTNGGK